MQESYYVSHSFQYSSYDEKFQSMDHDYPKFAKEEFPGIVGRVDAAYQQNGNNFLQKKMFTLL